MKVQREQAPKQLSSASNGRSMYHIKTRVYKNLKKSLLHLNPEVTNSIHNIK